MTIQSYSRAYEATVGRSGNPNPAKSFKGWQNYAATVRQKFAKISELYRADRESILKDYSSSKAAEMLAERQADYEQLRRHVEKEVRAQLDAVIESKREAIRKASAAPTDEDIRLLSALKMRSHLTESDVIHAAEAVSDNLVALGTLADIANDAGIHLPIPTAERLEEQIDKAAQYGDDMIRKIHKPDNELDYKAIEFFNYPDAAMGYAVEAFEELDNSVFSAVPARRKIETAKFNTKGVVNPNANAAEITLKDGDSLGNIAVQFGVRYSAIEAANPGKDLSDLHAGDKVIIPSTKMKYLGGGAGFVSADQVKPAQIGQGYGNAEV